MHNLVILLSHGMEQHHKQRKGFIMVDVDGYFFAVNTSYAERAPVMTDGYLYPLDGYYDRKYNSWTGTVFNPVDPVGPQTHYRMRAWNTITLSYEFWTSIGYPDPNPPSGDPVTGVTIIGEWTE